MEITRTLFKNSFDTKNPPEWTCPTCHKGVLNTDEKNIKTYECAESRLEHNHDAWEPSWMRGTFLGLFKCNNTECKELVVVTGDYVCDEHYEYHDEAETNIIVITEELMPTFLIQHCIYLT